MFKKSLILVAMLAAAGTTFAVDAQNVARQIPLKDGTTVYVFKDGKMAMEDKLGHTLGMKHGVVMETADGQRIVMVGNEIARLDVLRATETSGG